MDKVSSDYLGIGKIIDCHWYDTLNKLLRITGYIWRFKANILANDELDEIKFDNLIVPNTKGSKKSWLIFEKPFVASKENISQVENLFYLFQRCRKCITCQNRK